MKKELFGVFGDRDDFTRYRSEYEFDRVLSGDVVTVGVRDIGLGIDGRTSIYNGDDGLCVIWGEVFPPNPVTKPPAEWLFERYKEDGDEAFGENNGSSVILIEHDGEAKIAVDTIRSWEVFYTDAPGKRVFGTDASQVARPIQTPEVTQKSLYEFLHLGFVLDGRTVFDQLRRVPFDGYLTETGTDTLRRFVYEPEEFDYAEELARRLQRAIRRRSHLPGRKGLLLSAGYDSRCILSQLPEIDETFTIGTTGTPEVEVAKRLADQYDASHSVLETDDKYLNTGDEVIKHTNGVKESLHIHHGGYDDEMQVDTLFHGLLFDTLLRGHFLPRDGIEILGKTVPRERLDPEPDPIEHLATTLGMFSSNESLDLTSASVDANDASTFIREQIRSEFGRFTDRCESVYDAIELFTVRAMPTQAFHTHLASNYLDAFIAADKELIEWHLKTPPEHRNEQTYLKALRKLDPDMLKHRPPDRPHDSSQLNEVETFLRRVVPGLEAAGNPWPDRRVVYDRYNLDQKLFPGYTSVHSLPVRMKLRINDISRWMRLSTSESQLTPEEVIAPPRV
ncbi:asparagine synthase-related protein [Haladaptatus sp. CMSO5]|uniref:asparagine synthase-related protein n=1 Tax=Haladaptatus sp. CMSO5 TaxID=3120514 RepID=UPI002FCDF7BD